MLLQILFHLDGAQFKPLFELISFISFFLPVLTNPLTGWLLTLHVPQRMYDWMQSTLDSQYQLNSLQMHKSLLLFQRAPVCYVLVDKYFTCSWPLCTHRLRLLSTLPLPPLPVSNDLHGLLRHCMPPCIVLVTVKPRDKKGHFWSADSLGRFCISGIIECLPPQQHQIVFGMWNDSRCGSTPIV